MAIEQKLLKNTDDIIMYLKEKADDLKDKNVEREFVSCFATLNNRLRYKYYWDKDKETETHKKFIYFFILLKKLAKLHGIGKSMNDDDLEYLLVNTLSGLKKGAVSIYLIGKTYNDKYKDLAEIRFPLKHIKTGRYKKYMGQNDLMELTEAEEKNEEEAKRVKKYLKKQKHTHEKKYTKLSDCNIFNWRD